MQGLEEAVLQEDVGVQEDLCGMLLQVWRMQQQQQVVVAVVVVHRCINKQQVQVLEVEDGEGMEQADLVLEQQLAVLHPHQHLPLPLLHVYQRVNGSVGAVPCGMTWAKTHVKHVVKRREAKYHKQQVLLLEQVGLVAHGGLL